MSQNGQTHFKNLAAFGLLTIYYSYVYIETMNLEILEDASCQLCLCKVADPGVKTLTTSECNTTFLGDFYEVFWYISIAI